MPPREDQPEGQEQSKVRLLGAAETDMFEGSR